MTSSARSLRTPGRGSGASASLGAVRQASLPAAPHANAFNQHAQHDAFLLKGLKKFGINAHGPAERVDPYGLRSARSGESIDVALVQRFYPLRVNGFRSAVVPGTRPPAQLLARSSHRGRTARQSWQYVRRPSPFDHLARDSFCYRTLRYVGMLENALNRCDSHRDSSHSRERSIIPYR